MTLLSAVLLSFSIFASLVGGPPESTANELLEQYFRIHTSLASDTTEGVSQAAARIALISREASGKEPKAKSQLAAVSEAATKLQTADVQTARDGLGELSKRVTAYLQAVGGITGAYQFYCSMAKKGWLQADMQTRNPYYGTSMSKCGELVP